MTSYVRILTTASVDSTPSLLVVGTNGDKILVNCGEGCQRAFLEASGLRLKSVKRVCLTHLHPTALGGLPGLMLTSADANENATVALAAMEQEKAIRNHSQVTKKEKKANAAAALAAQTKDAASNGSAEVPAQPSETAVPNEQPPNGQPPKAFPNKNTNKRPAGGNQEKTGSLELHGPRGTYGFVRSLRHFMRRDRFETRVYEGEQREPMQPAKPPEPKKKKKKKSPDQQFVDFSIEALAFQHCTSKGDSVPIQSFIFQTPSIVGRFRPDKAMELGIPKGPMYAQLKNGQSVTFVDKTTEKERTVHSHEVVEANSPGVAVAVIYCPTAAVLQQLKECQPLQAFGNDSPTPQTMDVMVHMTPMGQNEDYKAWVKSFPPTMDHIWLDSYETLSGNEQNEIRAETSPFVGASLGGMMRSMLQAEIHPSPIAELQSQTMEDSSSEKIMITGKRHLEYTLIPRIKRGVMPESGPSLQEKIEESKQFVKESGALELASKEDYQAPTTSEGEILFTGTGSALPCKHRNVTGICMTLTADQRMLLDCGEGTVGQLFRANPDIDVKTIQAVWISHPHADHHLGILRLLSERNSIAGGVDPLILIAPPSLFYFLSEYEVVDPTVRGSYTELNCYDLVPPKVPSPDITKLLETKVGITSLRAVTVSHCRHSFAVVMDCTHGGLGRVAYSGDCRPSMKFADLAVDSNILIHEATFEDGMEGEAVLKKHSTVGEALKVGKRMRAKNVLLTHFSQRYPRIPPLQRPSSDGDEETTETPVVFCFDFTRLTPSALPLASKLTDALRLLYPEEESKATSEDVVDVKTVMAIPGMFAQSKLL